MVSSRSDIYISGQTKKSLTNLDNSNYPGNQAFTWNYNNMSKYAKYDQIHGLKQIILFVLSLKQEMEFIMVKIPQFYTK